MKRFKYADWLSFWHRNWLVTVIFTWCSGVSCGFWLVSSAEPYSYSWMKALVIQRGSILGLLTVSILPFVISATAIRFHISYLITPLIFLKAFLTGYCRCCILYRFGSAGWLIAFLLLFSQSGSTVLLLWYWIRNINRTGQWHTREMCSLLAACLVLSIIEYLLVWSFLAELMV